MPPLHLRQRDAKQHCVNDDLQHVIACGGIKETLRREMVQLRREREEIRGRVEKMLHQIESISQEQVAS